MESNFWTSVGGGYSYRKPLELTFWTSVGGESFEGRLLMPEAKAEENESDSEVKLSSNGGTKPSIPKGYQWRCRLVKRMRIASLFPITFMSRLRDVYIKLMANLACRKALEDFAAAGYLPKLEYHEKEKSVPQPET
ncbi:hypothetical protein L7F22_006033 [Adiantum nelumboides]|nr:hypothetical protein [Adiantum nelumboides]